MACSTQGRRRVECGAAEMPGAAPCRQAASPGCGSRCFAECKDNRSGSPSPRGFVVIATGRAAGVPAVRCLSLDATGWKPAGVGTALSDLRASHPIAAARPRRERYRAGIAAVGGNPVGGTQPDTRCRLNETGRAGQPAGGGCRQRRQHRWHAPARPRLLHLSPPATVRR